MTKRDVAAQPFTRAAERNVSVPAGHAAFSMQAGERTSLTQGLHANPRGPVFMMPVGRLHILALRSLGNLLLQEGDGRWRPLRVIGNLVYTITHPELLMDLLARDHIDDPNAFENELARIVSDLFTRVLDGDSWTASNLTESLECASGELMRRLEEAVAPLGLGVQSFELDVSPVDSAIPAIG
jgi:hypothetical protein